MARITISTATIDLSPVRPTPMGGFAGPERLSTRADGRLEANLVAIGEGQSTMVLVSLDALFAGAHLTQSIQLACERIFGIGPERVVILASHTHFAPMLDCEKPALGRCDKSELARWTSAICDGLSALRPDRATHVRRGEAVSEAAVNRRLRWRWPTVVRMLGRTDSDVYLCDNPDGPIDPRIRTCVWLSDDETPLAAVWSFACHPVFYPETSTASPDYIGVVRESLRQRFRSPELPVVFAPGCMGDAWPRSPRRWMRWSRLHHFILFGPTPQRYTADDWKAWAAEIASSTIAADDAAEVASIDVVSWATKVDMPLSSIMDDDNGGRSMTVKALEIPGLGSMIALACEPVAEIAGMLAAPSDLVVGYEGDVFGYLPTQAMVREGGYEPKGSHRFFGLRGRFLGDLDRMIRGIGGELRARRMTIGPGV